MGTRATGRVLVWGAVLGLGVAAAGGPVRLDPGEGGVTAAPITPDGMPFSVVLRIEPGARAPLRPMMGEYRIRVQRGELTLVMQSVAELIHSGETRVIPAGMDFQLVNRGAEAADAQVTVTFASLSVAPRHEAPGQP